MIDELVKASKKRDDNNTIIKSINAAIMRKNIEIRKVEALLQTKQNELTHLAASRDNFVQENKSLEVEIKRLARKLLL